MYLGRSEALVSSPSTIEVVRHAYINHSLRLLEPTLAAVLLWIRIIEYHFSHFTSLVYDPVRDPKGLEDFDRAALET